MTAIENFSNLSSQQLDNKIKRMQKVLGHWDLIHRELSRLENNGFLSHFSVKEDVIVIYEVDYLGNDPDNGWDRKTADRFALIVEILRFFGFELTDYVKQRDGYPGQEIACFEMSIW